MDHWKLVKLFLERLLACKSLLIYSSGSTFPGTHDDDKHESTDTVQSVYRL